MSAVAKTSDFTFGTQLGFANQAHHKISKVGVTAWFLAMDLYKIMCSTEVFLQWLKLQWLLVHNLG